MPSSSAMSRSVKALFLSLIFATAIPAGFAYAGSSLVIQPTRIDLEKGQHIKAIKVENQGDADANIHLELMNWTQVDGKDVYTATDEMFVLACPPLFQVKAGETQIVRVGIEVEQANSNVEGTYRLFIQEIPPAPIEGGNAIQVAVRIGVPVFLLSQDRSQPPLDWHIKNGGDDGVWMVAHNSGNSHVLINGVELSSGSTFSYKTAAHQYILPGSEVSWRIDRSNPITQKLPEFVTVHLTTDFGHYNSVVIVEE
ncbi:MAG: molecular chaperone [Sphingomonadales bacterium]|nr:molecular chaperone [Sphingomonadales bacterium]